MNIDKLASNPNILLEHLLSLYQEIYREGNAMYCKWLPKIERPSFRYSAQNLAYYLSLRRRDLRQLQRALMPWGLSSLGRSEARAITNLESVIASLGYICGREKEIGKKHRGLRAYFRGDWLLGKNSDMILGKRHQHRNVRIMVTLPTEAAQDYNLVRTLLDQGMDVARINCAHDSQRSWEAMIANIRQAEKEIMRPCKILMDLGGPKPRIERLMISDTTTKLYPGSQLFLTKGKFENISEASFIASVSIPQIFDYLRVEDPVLIDDGKIEGKVTILTPDGALVSITNTGANGVSLKPQKGLNFPLTPLELSPLTETDLQHLDFAVNHADAIGYSFVKEPADIELLQKEIGLRAGNERKSLAIVAKIETLQAIQNLPEIIVQGAAKHPLAIMIARGDLAVELGYRRLAELQEEIMWICEAAHVPVIWATQVLENMVRQGTPSRAEVTDAAMAVRAECVMLNKGPFLPEAIAMLDDIITRMEAHQYKKTSQLRALSIARPQD
ncbi:MAG TPA: pyruvate kinase [Methylomusa anaerophila]|uniref:Pyruvate kinase n=1 Tax=Methylomusa anaerophila TaxID=1930071 RepID=A0A348AFV1_9FIRM|nr:pyruvate kinase [Methylomusa anaerophila]BBB89949.1 pyruvate kinase [Methylomusa anaerophila]HML88324.1 pyruvate kinase [Methylomusa anaerophila]